MTEQSSGGTSAMDAVDIAIGTAVAATVAGAGPEKPVDPAQLPRNCLNCNAVVRGRYCTDCGQNNDTHVPTLAEVLGDALTSMFNLDSRLWRTLGTLFFRPGRLTQDFLAGKRARYVPPLRLYLVLSVLLFLIAALNSALDEANEDEIDLADTALTQEQQAALDAEIDRTVNEELAEALGPLALPTGDGPAPDFSQGVDFGRSEDGNLTLTDAEGRSIEVEEDYDCDEMEIPGVARGNVIDSAVREACLEGRADNFEAIKDAFVDNIPLLAFLVIPVMAVVFKLFYVFKGCNYLAHLVFLCHTHAFTFLLFIVLTLLQMLGELAPGLNIWITVIGVVLFLFYMPTYYFLALRRVYEQGVLLTLLKQLTLMFVYMFATLIVFSVGFVVVMLVS